MQAFHRAEIPRTKSRKIFDSHRAGRRRDFLYIFILNGVYSVLTLHFDFVSVSFANVLSEAKEERPRRIVGVAECVNTIYSTSLSLFLKMEGYPPSQKTTGLFVPARRSAFRHAGVDECEENERKNCFGGFHRKIFWADNPPTSSRRTDSDGTRS